MHLEPRSLRDRTEYNGIDGRLLLLGQRLEIHFRQATRLYERVAPSLA